MTTNGSRFSWFMVVFRAFLVVILAVMLLPAQAQAAQPRSGGDTLIASIDGAQLETLDPAVTWSFDTTLISTQIMETLVDYDAVMGGPVAGLATAWIPSVDGLTWTFTIRLGVKFQDGSDLTGQAVMVNFERWWDPANPNHGAANYEVFDNFFGNKDDPGTVIAAMESSDTQFILHLTRPMSNLPAILIFPNFAIASPTAITAGQMDTHPVGTGAYQFQSWDQITGEVDLVEYADYWGEQPYIPNAHFSNIVSAQDRLTAIQNNILDIAYDIPVEEYDAARQNLDVYVTHMVEPVLGYLGINRAHGPLADARVRQAIAHAINKQAVLLQHYSPVDTLAEQFLPTGLMGRVDCNGDCEDQDFYDPQAALDLLKAAGYPNGFTINLEYRNVSRPYLRNPAGVAQAIHDDLARVGIQVNVIEQPSSLFLQRVMNGNVDLFLLGWGADYAHPDNFFSPIFCGAYAGGFGLNNGPFCDSVSAAFGIQDAATQRAAYQALSQQVLDDVPLAPLVNAHSMIVTRATVAGWEKNVQSAVLFRKLFRVQGPSEVVYPQQPTVLNISGEQTITTTVRVPAGAVDEQLVLDYTVVETLAKAGGISTLANEPAQVGPLFRLTAYAATVPLDLYTFNAPVELEFFHGGFLREIDITSLQLWVWQEDQWQDASVTCQTGGNGNRAPGARAPFFQICATGLFRVTGAPRLVYFPLID